MQSIGGNLGALTPALGQLEQPQGVGTEHHCPSDRRDECGSSTFITGPFVPKPQRPQTHSAPAQAAVTDPSTGTATATATWLL